MARLTYSTYNADILDVLGAFVSFRFPRPDLEVTSRAGFVSIKLPTSIPGSGSTTATIQDPTIFFFGPGLSLTSEGFLTGTVTSVRFHSTERVTSARIEGLSIPGSEFGNRIDFDLWSDLFTKDITEIQGAPRDHNINLSREYEAVEKITLGKGDDSLTMGSHIDLNGFVAYGREGNDTFSFTYGAETLTYRGNAGVFTIGDQTNFALVDFETFTANGTGAITFFGSARDEEISGRDGADKLFGGGGDDTLTGTGNDQLLGGAGNDTLIGIHNDILDGQKGSDMLTVRFGFAGQADGGAGRDTITYGIANTGVLINLEKQLVRFDDKVVLRFESIEGANGTGGADVLIGSDGNNALYGDDRKDTLFGGAGKDRLDGGDGNDRLTGGIGADVFVFVLEPVGLFSERRPGHDKVLDFNPSRDRIEIEGFRLVDSWREVKSNMTERDGDTVIRLAKNDSITLLDVTPDELTKDHFIL